MQLPATRGYENIHVTEAIAALRDHSAARFSAIMERHRIDPNACDGAGRPLVCIATEMRSVRALGWLIDNGADVNAVNPLTGTNAVFAAAKNPNPAMAALLLSAGAHPDMPETATKQRPLHAAVASSWTEKGNTVELLLNAGAKLESSEHDGKNVRMLAALYENREAETILRIHANRSELEAGLLEPLKREDLLTANKHGLALLDTPNTWHRWREVCAALTEGDSPMSKAELLAPRDNAPSWLERGIACHAGGAIIEQLCAQGEYIGIDELLDDKGAPSQLCNILIEKNALSHVFSSNNWQDTGHNLRKTYQAIGEKGQHQVTNYHALLRHVTGKENDKSERVGR